MKNRPLVSCFIKCRNQAPYIRGCIHSLFNQTYRPMEIICLDDCSTDSTWKIMTDMVKEGAAVGIDVRVFRNFENLGIALGTEKAISLCRGVLCIDQDGDDIAMPNRVERIVEDWQKDGKKQPLLCTNTMK